MGATNLTFILNKRCDELRIVVGTTIEVECSDQKKHLSSKNHRKFYTYISFALYIQQCSKQR